MPSVCQFDPFKSQAFDAIFYFTRNVHIKFIPGVLYPEIAKILNLQPQVNLSEFDQFLEIWGYFRVKISNLSNVNLALWVPTGQIFAPWIELGQVALSKPGIPIQPGTLLKELLIALPWLPVMGQPVLFVLIANFIYKSMHILL